MRAMLLPCPVEGDDVAKKKSCLPLWKSIIIHSTEIL